MKVLVSAAPALIGCTSAHLCRRLLAEGHDPVGLDGLSEAGQRCAEAAFSLAVRAERIADLHSETLAAKGRAPPG